MKAPATWSFRSSLRQRDRCICVGSTSASIPKRKYIRQSKLKQVLQEQFDQVEPAISRDQTAVVPWRLLCLFDVVHCNPLILQRSVDTGACADRQMATEVEFAFLQSFLRQVSTWLQENETQAIAEKCFAVSLPGCSSMFRQVGLVTRMLGSCHAANFSNAVLACIFDLAALLHTEEPCHNYRSWNSCCTRTKHVASRSSANTYL